MIELIPEKELQMMDAFMDQWAFIRNSDERRLPASKILEVWEVNKGILFKLLGNKLFIEREFEYDKSKDELCRDMQKILTMKFVNEFDSLTNYSGFYQNDYKVASLIYPSTLIENVYSGEDFILPVPNSLKPIKVQKGEKIMKILSKIAKAHNLEGFEEFRIKHSQVLNQKKISGVARLSIHPMDYMTMSEGGCYNWTSCMHWDGGEYRQGSVEMMNSRCAVIAYVRNTNERDNVKLPDGNTWPAKRWRSLYLVTEDLLTNVLGYPYSSESLDSFMLQWLRELAAENLGWHYYDQVFEYNAGYYTGGYFAPLDRHLKINPQTGYMYNDFGDDQKGYIGINFEGDTIEFNYSGPSQCLSCGDIHPYMETHALVCEQCEPSCRCADCGDYIEDEVYEVDGDYYCAWCYADNFFECELSGELTHREYGVRLYLSPDNGKTIYTDYQLAISENYIYYPDNVKQSFNSICKGSIYKTIEPEHSWTPPYYFIKMEDLTEEGKILFDVDSPKWMDCHRDYNESAIFNYEPIAFMES